MNHTQHQKKHLNQSLLSLARTSALALLLLTAACAPVAPATVPAEPNVAQPTAVVTELPTPTSAPAEPTAAPTIVAPPVENLKEGCISDFDPNIDYFPEKLAIQYSEGWKIEYFNHYKVITVLNPWRNADQIFQYVLVQCGAPVPDGYANAQVVEVPIDSIITMSTTQLPHLVKLGRLDALIGHNEFKYISTPEVRALIEAGKLIEVGSGAEVNIELVLDANPDLVMTFGLGNPQWDAHPKLLEAGLKVALNSEYMETSPLGRAEWIKFTAAFFNEEAKANTVFAEIADRYNTMSARAKNVEKKPTVFTDILRGDNWSMPGGRSYVARFLADAGAAYLWAEDDSTGSLPLDFETVFERAAEADFWLNTGSWTSRAEAANADERYTQFRAYQTGAMYNNNARLNENGGNDYWEGGVANPDVVLADLIKIFHPDLLPDHELFYYRKLD
ncbi:MAG: ABC transporter substrate-binding protein [Candidatus Roseilinea sp.]|uniref:ABC transporter substrate-binding protein n=1 Tax=Candidatus Roseilinea sp. TaxID=2838777 RepID=UPI00404B9D0C